MPRMPTTASASASAPTVKRSAMWRRSMRRLRLPGPPFAAVKRDGVQTLCGQLAVIRYLGCEEALTSRRLGAFRNGLGSARGAFGRLVAFCATTLSGSGLGALPGAAILCEASTPTGFERFFEMATGAELIRKIKEKIREVDPKEVHQHLNGANGNGAGPRPVIVDVREQHE